MSSVIIDDIDLPVLSMQDLMETTWDYESRDFLGVYNGSVVSRLRFFVKDFDYLHQEAMVRRCNVLEGWLDFYLMDPEFHGYFKIENGEKVIRKETLNSDVDIESPCGDLIVTLKHGLCKGKIDERV